MDAAQILDQLSVQGQLPVEALRAATADRKTVAPIFVQTMEQYLSVGGDRRARDAIFFISHLLGEWRETSAYRPFAELLRRPRKDVDAVFGGAVTETTHRVMAAVFDGDPKPLYDVILEPEADEFIRSRMCEAIAMVTLRGQLPRAEAARFLRACYSELKPQEECFVWQGWQSAIAMLGLVELKPLVEQAFARGLISLGWLEFKHFEEDLQRAIADPDAFNHCPPDEFSLFGDTVEELSSWYCFRPKEPEVEVPWVSRWDPLQHGTATNPLKDVGRNDPCPCGSGIKFKKCCLAASVDSTALQAM
jgi:hypothetical protein